MILFLLTGCWDQVDIEERGFVVGAGIDLMDKKQNGEYQIKLTNQFVVPSSLGTPAQGGGESKAFSNISATGESMYAIDQEMAQLTSRSPFFEHLKIIVISKDVAEIPNLFAEMMDIFLRDPEMRRGIKVLISDGDAKDILDVKPENEKLTAIYIESIMENSFKIASVLEPVRIGAVHAHLLDQNSYVIPKIAAIEKGLRYEGAAVFHGYDNKMIGELDGDETKGFNLITGNSKKGTLKIKLDEEIIAYELEEVKSEIRVDTKAKDNITISVKINVEGSIAETFGTQSLLKKKNLTEIQKQVEKEIEKIANHTIKKAQEELRADVLGIGNILKQRHYEFWQTVKNEWDHGENYFAKSKFNVSANAKVRATGSTNQTKNQWSDR